MAKEKSKGNAKHTAPKHAGCIISNPKHARSSSNIQLLRITLSRFETKVDFGYQATSYYINGGWIKISPETFIRTSNTDKKLILTNATNIPYGPEKLHFNSSIEWRYFSLHFPSIWDEYAKRTSLRLGAPAHGTIQTLDLIENENGDENDFNFYGVRLDEEKKITYLY